MNAPANRRLMSQGPDAPLLLELENYDKDTGSWEPAAVFSRRVVGSSPHQGVDNAADAMSVVVNETGSLDFDRMGQLLGQSPDSVREALASEGLIFHNPLGNWEPASEYLTGPVREKLQTARRIAAQDPSYQGNVAALEAVQPPDIPAGEIGTPLGAPWIPDSLVNQWLRENWHTFTSRPEEWFEYSADIGKWSNPQRVHAYEATLTSEWGTPGMDADKILLHVLQGSPITVTKSDGNGGRVKDVEGTLKAQEKAAEMQESFNDWLWKDPERNSRLVRIYNDAHNNTRPRVFDGSHQTFPGMAPHWQEQMREHRRDAIFRVGHDGTALLAHEVGFGKTAVMVASAMERKRLGLIDKPIFVVPKATHRQFVADFRKIYPGAKLLSPEDKEFSDANREAFLNRVATGDWDGVVLTGEQFQKIPVSPQTEAKWTRTQIDDLRSALDDLSSQGDGGRRRGKSSLTEKQIEKKMETLSVKLQDLHAEMNGSRDKRVPYFETLGIDQIYVDEADRYKNLPFATQMGQVKGLPNSESKRAWDMFLKVQYIQGKGARKSGPFASNGVVFATGTPIANTIAEVGTMMRYLQLPELRKRGLNHFDAWAKTYGSITSGMEQTPQGKYRVTQRFAKFVNPPELSKLFQNVADIRVASEVPEMLAAQSRLVDPEGNPKRTTVVAPLYPELREYMSKLNDRVDNLSNVDPSVDNMLLITQLERVIDGFRERIPKMEVDARLAESTADVGFTVWGKAFDSRPKAGEAMAAALKDLKMGAEPRELGKYKSFTFSAAFTNQGYQLIVSNPASDVPYKSSYIEEVNPAGLTSRVDNLVKGIPKALEGTKEKLEQSETSRSIYRTQAGKSFERSGELSMLERELRATQAALSGEPVENYPAADDWSESDGRTREPEPTESLNAAAEWRRTATEVAPMLAGVELRPPPRSSQRGLLVAAGCGGLRPARGVGFSGRYTGPGGRSESLGGARAGCTRSGPAG